MNVATNKLLDDVIANHHVVFKDKLGAIKGMEAKILVQAEANPRYYRPRPVPYALRHKVDAALEKMEKTGVIERMEHSHWVAPILPIF